MFSIILSIIIVIFIWGIIFCSVTYKVVDFGIIVNRTANYYLVESSTTKVLVKCKSYNNYNIGDEVIIYRPSLFEWYIV